MSLHFVLLIAISLVSIACMLLRPRGIIEAYWACAGALLLVGTRLLSLHEAEHAVWEGVNVYLFLAGMMMLAELAREQGVFEWVADMAALEAGGSASRLFALVYLAGVIVTALFSNDATAVVLTPAVLAVVRKAKAEPKAYVLACALIANAASFVLPISNPANLVVFGKHLPPLLTWLRTFLLPSIASITITFIVLSLISKRDLQGSFQHEQERVRLSSTAKLAVLGLGLASLVLIVTSALGIDLGAPTLAAALIAMFLVTIRARNTPVTVMKAVSWSVLPLVAGLFVIVQGLQDAGLLRIGLHAVKRLTGVPTVVGNLSVAFGVALASNGMNNLPVGLMSNAAGHEFGPSAAITHSLLIGVDLGPNLSVTGSLATILWLIALRRENVEITALEFFKVGVVAMPLSLLCSILLVGQ